MIPYIVPFGFAFLLVLILVPLLRKIAFHYQFVDLPNHRKIHQEPIPLLGGIALFISYIVSIWIWVEPLTFKASILITGSLIVGIGLLDDYYKTRKRELSPLPKILIHFVAGIILFALNIRIEGISAPFHEGMLIFTPGLSLFVTLVWIIGLMNMMNFLDGADGLASGIALISSVTLFLISLVKGQEMISMLSIIFAGVNLGFLRYNFYPAKIFMGDTGSAFLGLVLAVISIEGTLKSATLVSIMMVILAFGVPIFDTAFVLLKRWKNHRPLHMADKTHAHHRLLKRGYTQKQAVAFIYVVSILFSLLSALILFWLVY